jgi:hypothetical protein
MVVETAMTEDTTIATMDVAGITTAMTAMNALAMMTVINQVAVATVAAAVKAVEKVVEKAVERAVEKAAERAVERITTMILVVKTLTLSTNSDRFSSVSRSIFSFYYQICSLLWCVKVSIYADRVRHQYCGSECQ